MKLSPTMVPGLGRHGGAPCAGGTPSPSRLETSVSLSQPLPCTSCLKPPCLSFPPELYDSPFTPNCLIFGRRIQGQVTLFFGSKGSWQAHGRGAGKAVGVETRWGGKKPLSQSATELRCWHTSPLPILRETTATPFPWGTAELGGSIPISSPFSGLCPALSRRSSQPGSHGRGRSRPFPQHGRGGGRARRRRRGGGCRHWEAAG